MILDLFFFIFLLCAFLIFIGFYTKLRYLAALGFVVMFILSAWVMLYQYMPVQFQTSGLELPSGSVIVSNGSVTTVTTSYVVWADSTTFWIGFLLSFVSSVSIWLVVTYED